MRVVFTNWSWDTHWCTHKSKFTVNLFSRNAHWVVEVQCGFELTFNGWVVAWGLGLASRRLSSLTSISCDHPNRIRVKAKVCTRDFTEDFVVHRFEALLATRKKCWVFTSYFKQFSYWMWSFSNGEYGVFRAVLSHTPFITASIPLLHPRYHTNRAIESSCVSSEQRL